MYNKIIRRTINEATLDFRKYNLITILWQTQIMCRTEDMNILGISKTYKLIKQQQNQIPTETKGHSIPQIHLIIKTTKRKYDTKMSRWRSVPTDAVPRCSWLHDWVRTQWRFISHLTVTLSLLPVLLGSHNFLTYHPPECTPFFFVFYSSLVGLLIFLTDAISFSLEVLCWNMNCFCVILLIKVMYIIVLRTIDWIIWILLLA